MAATMPPARNLVKLGVEQRPARQPEALPVACSSVQAPIAMKPMPAAYDKYFGFKDCDTSAPAATPIAVVNTSAADAATKIVHRLTALRDANNKVASCVLSPSSARNTVPKTVANIFQSMSLNLAPASGAGRRPPNAHATGKTRAPASDSGTCRSLGRSRSRGS